MQDVSLCAECGVPEMLTSSHSWLDNGDIVSTLGPSNRVAFMECENLDPLFKNIGDIIGLPIEPMLINIMARVIETRLSSLIPEDIKTLLLSMKPGDAILREKCRQLIEGLNDSNLLRTAIAGYGKYEQKGYRYERDQGDYSIIWVTEPFSVPYVVGSHMGHNAAIIGGENVVDYREISPGVYELTAHWASLDETLKERLPIIGRNHKPGDMELKRCDTCGGPATLSVCKWDLDRGVILNTLTGKRMAMLGPSMLDPVFQALEDELGETIPRTVVEAQRRFVGTGFFSEYEMGDEESLREHLALRGLGNLKELEMAKHGARIGIDAPIMQLFLVGMMQGLFEVAFDVESIVDWDSQEENLTVEVTPKP